MTCRYCGRWPGTCECQPGLSNTFHVRTDMLTDPGEPVLRGELPQRSALAEPCTYIGGGGLIKLEVHPGARFDQLKLARRFLDLLIDLEGKAP